MPHSICNCCIQKLKSSHAFIKQALICNEKLWSQLKRSQAIQDCLQEAEIDIQTCLEIKMENKDELPTESCKESMLSNCLQINEIDNLNLLEKISMSVSADISEDSEGNEMCVFCLFQISSCFDTDFSQIESTNLYRNVVLHFWDYQTSQFSTKVYHRHRLRN